MRAELAVAVEAILGEGPVWHPVLKRLYWLDIQQGLLHVHDPCGPPDSVVPLGRVVGAAVPRSQGGWILAAADGLWECDLLSHRQTLIAHPESHLPHNRFNDGKCDAQGRFWVGTMALDRTPGAASLYCLDVDRRLRRVLPGVTTSNGLDWSPDQKTMYYIDTPTLQVAAFDFDLQAGHISNRRVVVQFPQDVGRPDGMTVDAEGMLWVAHWNGGRISRWDPHSGRLLTTVLLPVTNVTSCTYGGENLDRLYVTTARHRLPPEQLAREPHAGALFVVEPGVAGLPANLFGS